jgi:hypothetical protein
MDGRVRFDVAPVSRCAQLRWDLPMPSARGINLHPIAAGGQNLIK